MNRNFVNINTNPCKMCMPMGGCLAFKGIENTMVLMHGSQGCSTYIRRHISTHYNEPIDIASSALNEKETVYGGARNLKKGIQNVMKLYEPEVIGVITTCLAETIGEDIKNITEDFKIKHDVTGLDIITVSTPGYGGSHYEGYFAALKSVIEYYNHKNIEEPGEETANGTINIITTLMTPEDQRHLKYILEAFEINYILLPDITETLDAPFQENYNKIPRGGTPIKRIQQMHQSSATIEIGTLIPENLSPGTWLETSFAIPCFKVPMPIGIEATDALLNLLSKISKKPIPIIFQKERGRLLDAMVDSHKYNAAGVAAIFGEPESVLASAKLCFENGITPKIVATGTLNKAMRRALNQYDTSDSIIIDDTDFDTIQKLVRENNINILIGNSDGKFIMEKENVPLVRIGFPIHDQVGAQRKLYIGYRGTMRFLDDITNTLLDDKHHGYRTKLIDQFYNVDPIKKERT